METQKILNLLNVSDNENSKFATKKWNITGSESKGNYSTENRIKVLTSSLESSLCDCSDAYILVTGNITITVAQLTQMQKLHLKIAHHSKNAEQK